MCRTSGQYNRLFCEIRLCQFECRNVRSVDRDGVSAYSARTRTTRAIPRRPLGMVKTNAEPASDWRALTFSVSGQQCLLGGQPLCQTSSIATLCKTTNPHATTTLRDRFSKEATRGTDPVAFSVSGQQCLLGVYQLCQTSSIANLCNILNPQVITTRGLCSRQRASGPTMPFFCIGIPRRDR